MMNKKRIKIIIIAIIIIPIIVALLLEFNMIWKVETDNDWIGFYASYIGSIIGVIGVFEVMRIDQMKRDEERKSELFLNNLPIYEKIISSIQVEELSQFKERLTKIRSETNWNMVDSSTKKRLKQIEGNISYIDESFGLFYAVGDFIRNNLYDELRVTIYSHGDRFDGPNEYEDVPEEILNEFTNIVLRYSYVELVYENVIKINVSKDKLLEKFEEKNNTRGYSDKMDVIYTRLSQINESKEWSDYISKRAATFTEMRNLANQINSRIERVLNY